MSVLAATTLMSRSLRVDARSMLTYGMRAGIVGFLFLTLLNIRQSDQWRTAPGLTVFGQTLMIDFAFITLAGTSLFATAITEEKEQMTLGLLRMTDLSPVSILLGKAASRLCGALLLLLAQVPFTVLAISLGGIGVNQIMAAFAALGAYLLLVANLALLCSVICRRSAGASVLVVLLLMAFHIGPWAGKGLLQLLNTVDVMWAMHPLSAAAQQLCQWLIDASPIQRLGVIMLTGFRDPVINFQVISNVAASMIFFILAWLSLDWFNFSERPAAPARVGLRSKRSSRRAWQHSLIWKDFCFITGGLAVLVLKLVVYALIIALIAYALAVNHSLERKVFCLVTIWVFIIISVIEASLYAGRIFREEIKWQTLSSIAILPMSLPTASYQKIVGCGLGLIPALLALAAGALIDLPVFAQAGFEAMSHIATYLSITIVIFFLHLVAYLSLWMKWGAIVASVAAMIFMQSCCSIPVIMFAGMGSTLAFCLIFALLWSGIVLMHVHGGRRLGQLAASA